MFNQANQSCVFLYFTSFFCILQDFKVFLRVQLLASGPGCQAERRILGFRPSVQLPISIYIDYDIFVPILERRLICVTL